MRRVCCRSVNTTGSSGQPPTAHWAVDPPQDTNRKSGLFSSHNLRTVCRASSRRRGRAPRAWAPWQKSGGDHKLDALLSYVCWLETDGYCWIFQRKRCEGFASTAGLAGMLQHADGEADHRLDFEARVDHCLGRWKRRLHGIGVGWSRISACCPAAIHQILPKRRANGPHGW